MTPSPTLTTTPVTFPEGVRFVNRRLVGAAAILIALGLVSLQTTVAPRQTLLFVVGLFAGVTLYHAAFGFTSAWRVFVSDRRGAGLRAQMLMLALTVGFFVPILSFAGPQLGLTVRGSVAPLSISLLVGSFLFGLGMQLGGGCASGTLFSAGGGNVRMVVTLLFFIAGSLLGTRHAPFWSQTAQLPPVSLLAATGPTGALGLSFALFSAIAWLSLVLERRRHGPVPDSGGAEYAERWWHGPWPLVWGAVGLCAVNVATLLLAGRPWGITSAFALWGAKGASVIGMDVASWPYWSSPARLQSLNGPILADVTSVMDIGIMIGALMAAALAGRFAPSLRVPARSLFAAVIGGLMLGYGARLAYGCNIGAFFSGVASTSLHGWVWFVCAFAGTVLGTRLRPWFGLGVEITKRPTAC